jgi:predicted metal-dependent hydrolase
MNPQIDHKLIRSNRRTLALIINSDNDVIVRAPLYTSVEYINKFIEKHKTWILKKKEQMALITQNKKKKDDIDVNKYKEQARLIISELVRKYSNDTGIKCNGIKISSARTRWGSCNSKGVLSFTWRLAMAPLEVIEYVVVHELVHVVQKDHSKKFWAKVAAIYPDYKSKRAWLRVHGREF